MLKTTNSGKIWNTEFWNYGYYPFTSVFFIDELQGWISGSGSSIQIYRTTDGGYNWIPVYSTQNSITDAPIFFVPSSILFIDNNIGWCAYEGGSSPPEAILKSTDGGITWIEKSSIGGSSIFFINNNNGWTVGAAGLTRKSTDGGETWISKISGTTSDLNFVKFYNTNLGICVGDSGTVLLSTDGGETWTSKVSGTTGELKSVTFTNSTSVWISGANGEILSTTNLGNTWTTHNNLTTKNLNTVFFTDEFTGWVSGMGGTMFKYSVEPPVPPVWSNQILVEDLAGTESSEEVLTFGQHSNATDSLDTSLGEYELPPPPPSGIFDARFNLPTNPQVNSFIDYRDSSQTDITWLLSFQSGSKGYPIKFSWDSLSFPTGAFHLTDVINETFVNVNMKNQSSYVLTNTTITSLKINYSPEYCFVVSIDSSWNLVSVPYLSQDMRLSSLFSTAISEAYRYDAGYLTEDTLTTGVGYWLKFADDESVEICGTTLGDTVRVETGWNLFGVYDENIPVDQITTTPPGIMATFFFGFEDGYYIADTLKSGKGYWLRVTADGILNLNSEGLTSDGQERHRSVIENDFGKVKLSDNEGKSSTLYLSKKEIDTDLYELPPIPPQGIFDARFSSGKLLENLNGSKIILISSDKYPITIKAESVSITIRDVINGNLLNEELEDGEEITITNNQISSIEITGELTAGLPITYELYQNYPNPFNPTTTIKFALPDESNVNLSVYNVIGELVQTLVNDQMKPGYYEFEMNGNNLASGIYIYRIKTGSFIDSKKMVLMK